MSFFVVVVQVYRITKHQVNIFNVDIIDHVLLSTEYVWFWEHNYYIRKCD